MIMNYILLFLAIVLVAMLGVGLRAMQEDHLFSIGHQVELGMWAMFAMYVTTVTFFNAPDALMRMAGINAQTTSIVQVILVGLMLSRLLSCAAFTLGNPPKVRIMANPKAAGLEMSPTTMTPGVIVDPDGSKRIAL
jgi:hypothetical protein